MGADDLFQFNGNPVIVGTGLISLDIVLGPDEISSPRLFAGGTCGNLLIILSYLGWKSFPVSRMNGDKASKHVVADLKRWGVQTDWAKTKPGGDTPIIVQRIQRSATGEISHRFSWKCPNCGAWLPGYRAVPAAATHTVTEVIKSANVFFFDRVSRGALDLASTYREAGALVVFEPSGVGEPRLFRAAIASAHIVKYAEDRIHEIDDLRKLKGPLLEIQTRGSDGLRYRRITDDGVERKWTDIAAIPTNAVRDTSGAGDWCSAGIIHHLGAKGVEGLRSATNEDIRRAIRLGQAMAAWNCKFEGARGGMYECEKKAFRSEIRALLDGRESSIHRELRRDRKTRAFGCLGPSCRCKRET